MNSTKIKFDLVLTTIIISLIGFGTCMIFSSSSILGLDQQNDMYFFLKKHLLNMGIGLVAFYVAAKIRLDFIRKHIVIFNIVVLLLQVAVLFMGTTVNGAGRWIRIGGFSIQPSEIAKVMLPITLAHMIDLRGRERLNNIKKGVAPIAGVIALYGATIFLQKHLSAVMIVSLISLTVLIAGGLSKKYIGTFFGLLGAVGFIGIATQPWRLARIVSFTNPQANPDQNGWHVIQSWYGLGSGEMFGLGLGMSRQKFGPWLPENHTDFIVGIIGEEIGLFGITILMLLFVALFIKLLGVAAQADTKFTALLVYGISSQLFYQTLINLLVVSGWFPVTGMPMPFISYGGSATIVLFGAIGLIYNVISHHKKLA